MSHHNRIIIIESTDSIYITSIIIEDSMRRVSTIISVYLLVYHDVFGNGRLIISIPSNLHSIRAYALPDCSYNLVHVTAILILIICNCE